MALQFQANWNTSFKPSTWPSKTHFHIPRPIQTSLFSNPKTFSNINSRSLYKSKPSSRKFELSASAVAAKDTTVDESIDEDTEKLGVVVKPVEKPRLVLKFIWMEKNIGVGIDQMIPGHGTIPLKSLLLLAQKRCLGRAQTSTREQALDIPKAGDHSSQSGY